MPALHAQAGYEGCYVLTTPEGKALVMTFWSDDGGRGRRPRERSLRGQVGKFVTFFRSPPGREIYDVGIADAPASSRGAAA